MVIFWTSCFFLFFAFSTWFVVFGWMYEWECAIRAHAIITILWTGTDNRGVYYMGFDLNFFSLAHSLSLSLCLSFIHTYTLGLCFAFLISEHSQMYTLPSMLVICGWMHRSFLFDQSNDHIPFKILLHLQNTSPLKSLTVVMFIIIIDYLRINTAKCRISPSCKQCHCVHGQWH